MPERPRADSVSGKRCSKCGETPPHAEFSPDKRATDGLKSWCKACVRKESRKWRQKNPDKVRENGRRWRENNRERREELRQRYEAKNPGRKRVRNIVAGAVRRGKLVRPETCERCDQPGQIEAHHEDYDKPLEVEWLCALCHRQHHLEQAAA